MLLNEGTVLGGRYEIINKIGVGGMAFVYKAKDLKLSRFVAVKTLREEFVEDEDFIERFRIEAHAVARLSHQNLVSVYDVGNEGDVHYIVMEYVKGRTLKALIEADAPFPEKMILGIAYQISNALQTAHKNNIIHRDIKPQNILVSEEGSVKVTDFGIARAVASKTITTKGNVMGSVHYFSPEQARGGYIDEKSDIYALGIVMYEMATGHIPYDGDTSVEIALKHISDDLPPIHQYNENISESLLRIIEKATEKKSEYRYQSIDALISDLKRSIKDKTGAFVVRRKEIESFETVQMNGKDIKIIQDEMKARKADTEIPKRVRPLERGDREMNSDKEVKDGKSDKRLIIAAAITSLVLIALISYFAVNSLIKDLTPAQTLENLENLSIEDADKYAMEVGIVLTKTEQNDNNVQKGFIISQDKQPGERIEKGMTVNVVVSLGSEMVDVPDICLMDEASAIRKIESLKIPLTIAPATYEFDDKTPIGIIFKQDPKQGEQAEPGEAIHIVISKGPEPKTVIVPNVIGEDEANAKVMLERVGLVVGSTTPFESSKYAKGKVTAQGKLAGTEVMSGTIVDLTISSGPPKQEETENRPSQSQGNSNTTSSEPKATKKVFTINPVDLHDYEDTVSIKLIFISDTTGASTEVYSSEASVSSFPKNVEITQKGKGKIQLYINNDMQWEEAVDFSG